MSGRPTDVEEVEEEEDFTDSESDEYSENFDEEPDEQEPNVEEYEDDTSVSPAVASDTSAIEEQETPIQEKEPKPAETKLIPSAVKEPPKKPPAVKTVPQKEAPRAAKPGAHICPLCLKVMMTTEIVTLPVCRHSFCIACLASVLTKLVNSESEQNAVQKAPCPFPGCPILYEMSDFQRTILKLPTDRPTTDDKQPEKPPERYPDRQREEERKAPEYITGYIDDKDYAAEDNSFKQKLTSEPTEFACEGPCSLPSPKYRMHTFPQCHHTVCFQCMRFEVNAALCEGATLRCPEIGCAKRANVQTLMEMKQHDAWFQPAFDRFAQPRKSTLNQQQLQTMLDTVKWHYLRLRQSQKPQERPAATKSPSTPTTNTNPPATTTTTSTNLLKIIIAVGNGRPTKIRCSPTFGIKSLSDRICKLHRLTPNEWATSIVTLKRQSATRANTWNKTQLRLTGENQKKTVTQLGIRDGDMLEIQVRKQEPGLPSLSRTRSCEQITSRSRRRPSR